MIAWKECPTKHGEFLPKQWELWGVDLCLQGPLCLQFISCGSLGGSGANKEVLAQHSKLPQVGPLLWGQRTMEQVLSIIP